MTITRRDLLGGLAVGALAGALPAAALAKGGYPWPLGVQLWSVNAELNGDVNRTLRELADLGFREVETAGLHGQAPAAFGHAIKAAGLRAVGAHYGMSDLFDDAPGHIAEAKAGCSLARRLLTPPQSAAEVGRLDSRDTRCDDPSRVAGECREAQ